MEIVKTIRGVRERVSEARAQGKRIGFVPTMGYLHDGHLSLVSISKQHSGYQVMSIFVNRIQFNDKRDFESYPIDLERDFRMAEEAGVDLVFVPDESEMYNDRMTSVDVQTLTEHLCGACRPGHFRGVFTVVSKLFNIVQPDVSVFGQKDIQQAVGIEKMVRDLDFPLRIIIAPIVREKDGLAMSSRNKRLTPGQRQNAVCIYRSLQRAQEMITQGEERCELIAGAIRDVLSGGNPDSIDYVSAANYRDLQPIERLAEKSVIAIAAFFGATRLIDNMIVEKNSGGYLCIY